MPDLDNLASLIRAGHPVIAVDTAEEARVVESFRHVIGKVWRPLYKWSLNDGLQRLDMTLDEPPLATPEATATLQFIKDQRERAIFLLCDFHGYLRYPLTMRLVREIVDRSNTAAHTLVLVGVGIEIPKEIEAHTVRVPLKLPDEATLGKLVREEAFQYSREHGGKRVEIDPVAFKTIVRNLLGLKLPDARRIARQLVFRDGAVGMSDLPELAKLKFELLNRDGVLHFEYETAAFADVAGLARLKQWVEQRRAIFLGENKVAGLDPPKGLLLLGVQGCGKSLAAKAIAGSFGVPLVRLDFGALYNKYHGETERNLRESLLNAEALSPCVLWCDEIEKGLATSDSDDGVSRRVLGALLTWMSERKKPVFLVATANDVSRLPPELLRKGRFDEIFFIDLPADDARDAIFRVHFDKRKLDREDFDRDALVAASSGFSGAEIEQAIVAALYAAHAEGVPLQQRHLLAELNATRPLSVLMAEPVQQLRDWAKTRTVSAD
ncbi:MAG: AAA family ATPase [Xanthomonadales bacterium]|nr:AAA family ATPase [Xanthomonadales bacterium]